MQTLQDHPASWDRRLLARLHTLSAAQQAAIMQTIELLAAKKSAAPEPHQDATVITFRRK